MHKLGITGVVMALLILAVIFCSTVYGDQGAALSSTSAFATSNLGPFPG